MNLDEAELLRRFERRIRPRVFLDAQRQEHPTTILLGGQPGAGKSRAGEFAAENAGGGVVPIVGDEYRRFHPLYWQVMRTDRLRMPDATAQAAGRWIQMCVDHAREQGYSMLIEGTWRNAQVPLQAARDAAGEGRRVDAVVVAVQPEVSRLGTMERYYRDVLSGDEARWTPPAAHDAAVASLPGTVEAVASSHDITSVRVVTRQGQSLFYSDQEPSPRRVDGAVAALRDGMSSALSPEDLSRYSESVATMYEAHQQLTATEPDARSAWTQIRTHDEPLMTGRSAAALARIAQPTAPSLGTVNPPNQDPWRGSHQQQPGRDQGLDR